MKILTSILMGIMMFTMSFTEIQAYNSQFIEDDDVNPFYIQDIEIDFYEVNSSGTYISQITSYDHWHQMTNGYVVFNLDEVNYDFTSMLDDGYYKLNGWDGSPYQYLYMFGLEFDIHNYYYEFQLIWGSQNDVELNWGFNGTNDPYYEDSNGNDVDLRLQFWNPEDLYITAFKNNYLVNYEGYAEGYEDGRQEGYIEGATIYGYVDENGDYYSAESWGLQEYQRGLNQGAGDTLSLQNMIPGVLGVFLAFFFQVMSISVLGVSILDIIVLMFGVAVVLLLFKTFVK
jgi:hypothetical protein